VISIISPCYNAAAYLDEMIKSVLNQTYGNWELLMINDGSTDNSKSIILSYQDDRIYYFEQENRGVSAARNIGLKHMKGDYFCFLDADDTLTSNSLENRLKVFVTDPKLTFVDGAVAKKDSLLRNILSIWKPNFQGNPLNDLVQLKGNSFFGPTWMVKRDPSLNYNIDTKISHGEDLLFFMELARKGGTYNYTNEIVLNYRNTPNSAMKNLNGLKRGYDYIANEIKDWSEIKPEDYKLFCARYKKSMFLSYVRNFYLLEAFKIYF